MAKKSIIFWRFLSKNDPFSTPPGHHFSFKTGESHWLFVFGVRCWCHFQKPFEAAFSGILFLKASNIGSKSHDFWDILGSCRKHEKSIIAWEWAQFSRSRQVRFSTMLLTFSGTFSETFSGRHFCASGYYFWWFWGSMFGSLRWLCWWGFQGRLW